MTEDHHLYECIQRKFTCKFCVEIDAEFSENFKTSQNQLCSTDLITEVINTSNIDHQNQTDTFMLIGTQDPTRKEINSKRGIMIGETKLKQSASQTDTYQLDSKESKSVTTQTDDHPVITKESKSSSVQQLNYQLVDLQELNKSTVSSLQESFVGAFDRINESVRSLKTNIDKKIIT